MLLNIQKYLQERARSHTSNNTRSCKKYKTTLEFRNILLHTEANTVQIEPAVIVESSYCKCEKWSIRAAGYLSLQAENPNNSSTSMTM